MKPTGVLITAEEIAAIEGCSPRWVRAKYQAIAHAKCNGDSAFFIKHHAVMGGRQTLFDLALLDALTQEKLQAQATAWARRGGEDTAATSSGQTGGEPVPRTALWPPSQGEAGALAQAPAPLALRAGAQLLPFDGDAGHRPALQPQPGPEGARRAWALARKAAIKPLLTSLWRGWRGQTFHGIKVLTMYDAVKALALDSRVGTSEPEAAGSLVDWTALNLELASATGNPAASLSPVSASTLWRWYSWYQNGKQIAGRTIKGLPALAPVGRSDKGTVHLSKVHAEYLTACFLGGDASVTRKSLAVERPRSAAECLELLKLEILQGELPGPEPSYYVVLRWFNEALPRVVTDYARLGKKRALQTRGPHLVVSHAHQEVNDRRDWDFRRSNVRCWMRADGTLQRFFLCGAIDEASRDVAFLFDLYPSAQLFKSTLRAALLKWEVAKQEWMDNGKEFTCEEVTGEKHSEWQQRFEIDAECSSIFDHLHFEAHYCVKENTNGKALLERF